MKKFVPTAVLTTITVMIFCLCFAVCNNILNLLPNATQLNLNLKSGGAALTIEKIEELSQRISLEDVGFCAQLDDISVKEQTVTPVLTNEYYLAVLGTETDGNGITAENIKNKDKIAVIGESLALKLFFTTDAVGETFEIGDDIYTVCGVFNEQDNIINNLSSDGKQRIYIPYTCADGYETYEVDTILYSNLAPSAPLMEQMDLSEYYSDDFAEKAEVIKDFEHILLFMLFVVLCVISIKIWRKLCGKFSAEIGESLRKNYFRQSVRAVPLKYILFILTALGIPMLLILIFVFSDFGIYIVPKYIPNDNIFDISHYISLIIQNANDQNNLALTGDTFLINLYRRSFSLLTCLCIAFAAVLVPTAAAVCARIKVICSRFAVRLRF